MGRIGSSDRANQGIGGRLERVLVVDDSPAVRQTLERCLRSVGLQGERVTTLERGDEAMRVFSELAPDLVFLDTSMQGIDPYDALQAILYEDASTKVVPVTGRSLDDPGVQSLLEFGAFDVIRKPVRSGDVEQTIETIRQEQDGTGRIR